MKNILLIAATAAFAINAVAQTTITSTSQIGYSNPIRIASAATATTVPVATVGSSVTWNCSNLTPQSGTPVINYQVSTPAGTLYASDYPNANWYWTDPAVSALVGHHYSSLTADSLVGWGAHTPGSSYEIYDNPEMELKLPFDYTDNHASTYSKTNYNSSGGVTSYQTGTNTLTYDGYGTLILPSGTFNNVARIKNVRTNSLGPVTTSYTWYQIPTGEQLLTYGTNGGVKVVYSNSIPSGTNAINTENITSAVTPNPFTTSTTLKITSSEPIKNYELKVYDLLGNEIKSIPVKGSETTINRDNMTSGVYFFTLLNAGSIVKTEKIVIK